MEIVLHCRRAAYKFENASIIRLQNLSYGSDDVRNYVNIKENITYDQDRDVENKVMKMCIRDSHHHHLSVQD